MDGSVAAIEHRRADAITCHAGCESCCHAELTVSDVEAASVRAGLDALEAVDRERVRERAASPISSTPRCVMLEADGRCAIYNARPLVCRTQGHALQYPDGVIPANALFARTKTGGVTWCPLNYTNEAPLPADIIDAERIDTILAVVNRRFEGRSDERVSLRSLAQF